MATSMKSVKPNKAKKITPQFCACGTRDLFKRFKGVYKNDDPQDACIYEGNVLRLVSPQRLGAAYEIPLKYCPKCGRKMKK